MLSPLRAAWRRDAPPFLVAAVSARPLAASALRGGHCAAVLDLFADADTRRLGYPFRNVCARDGLRFDPAALLVAADELAPPGACAGLVYGSGFESSHELLRRLAEGRRLYGNAPGTVAALKDPARFFPLLDRLGLPHPEVRFSPPPDSAGWLAKRRGGAGGGHVVPAARARPEPDVYFQRLRAGRNLSVLFLADGRSVAPVGFNEQWTASEVSPFAYGGGMGGLRLDSVLEARVVKALGRLVEATGLLGLNGLDFLADDSGWSVLEINPRPTASIEYYDADWPQGLFGAHLAACNGELPRSIPAPAEVRGHAVVYAAQPLTVSGGFRFPAWCRDIPNPGTSIPAGGPVCTVHAAAVESPEVTRLIRQRRASIEAALVEEAA